MKGGKKVKCYFHSENEAQTVCTNCGKAICEECVNIHNNKSYCTVCYKILVGEEKPKEVRRSSATFIGSIILILIGLFLLARNLHYLYMFWKFFWPSVVITVGLYFLIDYLAFRTKGSVISGLALGLLGIYLLSSYLDLIPHYVRGWPTFLGIIGIILLVYYSISQVKNYLFTGVFFLIIGALLLLNNLNIFSFNIAVKLWPVIFVILGIKLIYDMYKKGG